jgi:trk system potassium uptake protein TrkA
VKIVIVGCGRVGASAAEVWDAAGHDVIVLDISTPAFDRLPSTFGGVAFRGDGTDEDVLRRSGAEGADVLLAVTEGDNRNVMSCQLAVEALGVGKVIAKINDPVRARAYAELGVATLCRTGLMVDAVNAYLGLPPSDFAGMSEPTGHHPGGEHHPVPAPSSLPSNEPPTSSTDSSTGPQESVEAASGAAVEA